MLKSLLYKEWIKIRLIFWVALGIGMLALINIFLKVRHDILFVDAESYWYSYLFRGSIFFGILKFFPLIVGLAVAIAQYFPETVNKRIKLTFHLPVPENTILVWMHSFGALMVLIIYLALLGMFSLGGTFFFPSNIIGSSLLTMLPWFLGGITAYFLMALILLEPMWLYRGLYSAIAAGFISLFFIKAPIGAYRPALVPLTLITLLLSCVVLFSGYRLRKGEM